MRLNDEVLVSDNTDTYRCSITKLDEKGVILKVLEKLDGNPELKVKVGIAQGLVKKDKMEEVISKTFLPSQMNYSTTIFGDLAS